MTPARGRFLPQNRNLGADDDADQSLIAWMDADPRRAPLRNDLVTALEVALSPVVFWFLFFTSYYAFRTALAVMVFVMLVTFGVAFVLTWARMASARRRRATLRSPRRKASLALLIGIVIGYATLSSIASGYPDRSIQFLLGLGAGISAGVILLALERFAVDVPALRVSAVDKWVGEISRHRGGDRL